MPFKQRFILKHCYLWSAYSFTQYGLSADNLNQVTRPVHRSLIYINALTQLIVSGQNKQQHFSLYATQSGASKFHRVPSFEVPLPSKWDQMFPLGMAT